MIIQWLRRQHRDHRKLRARVEQAAEPVGGVTCDLCNDAAWWPQNGFSEGERHQICGPRDLNCPGFGGDDQ